VQLSLSQTLPLTGAVIVTTPQQVAVDDASRAVAMFEKLEVPVRGDRRKHVLFAHAGRLGAGSFWRGWRRASGFRTGTTFLGRIPLDPEIGKSGDFGNPIVLLDQNNPSAEALREVACNVAAEASIKAHEREVLE